MSRSISRPPQLQALTFSTEDLLEKANEGLLRLPAFQRTWTWDKDQVKNLFDSLRRGFPAGTLLMWSRKVEPGRVRFGDRDFGVTINSPGYDDSLFIVDGQQRITSLLGTLLHPDKGESPNVKDPFALYFDLDTQEFEHRSRGKEIPSHWLPVWVLGDTLRVLDWQARYPSSETSRAHIRLAHQVTKVIREYKWPVYVVGHDDEDLVRTIFDRVNNGGNPLKKEAVFQSLYGAREDAEPDLVTLKQTVTAQGLGDLPEDWLLKTIVALAGGDLSRVGDHMRKRDEILPALEAAGPILVRVLDFLKDDVGLQHLQLLPYRMPLPVLARLFKAHSDLDGAQRAALVRWLWRGAASGAHQGSTTLVRQALSAIDEGSIDASIRALAEQVPDDGLAIDLGRYDFRSATTKLGCNALLSLEPVDLLGGEPIDVAALLDREGAGAFRQIVRDRRYLGDADEQTQALLYHLANRIFHPIEPGESPWSLLRALADRQKGETMDAPLVERLATHGIEPDDLRALAERDTSAFLHRRASRLAALTNEWMARRTAPAEDEPQGTASQPDP